MFLTKHKIIITTMNMHIGVAKYPLRSATMPIIELKNMAKIETNKLASDMMVALVLLSNLFCNLVLIDVSKNG